MLLRYFIIFTLPFFVLFNPPQGNLKAGVKKTGKEIGKGGKHIGKEVGKAGKEVGKEIKHTVKAVKKK